MVYKKPGHPPAFTFYTKFPILPQSVPEFFPNLNLSDMTCNSQSQPFSAVSIIRS